MGLRVLVNPITWPFLACYVAFLLGEFVLTGAKRGTNDRRDRGTFAAFMVAIGVAFGAGFAALFSFPPSRGAWPRVAVGAALALGAETLRVVGKRQLGRFFTMTVNIQKDHRLVTEGLYARLRHPLYTAFALFFLAWPLTIPTTPGMLLGLAAGSLILVICLWRIRVEEEALAEAFGAEWRAYASRTWRLVPGLY